MFLYHQAATVSLQLSTYRPLARISLAMSCVVMTQRVFVPQVTMMKLSPFLKWLLRRCHLHNTVPELQKTFLSSMSMLSLKKQTRVELGGHVKLFLIRCFVPP